MPVTNATRRFRERRDIEKRISRPVDAIAVAGDITSLAVKLGELEMRRADIDADLRSAQPVPPRLAPAILVDRLAEWRRLLRQSTTQDRAVL
jgi:hypothetical protein